MNLVESKLQKTFIAVSLIINWQVQDRGLFFKLTKIFRTIKLQKCFRSIEG